MRMTRMWARMASRVVASCRESRILSCQVMERGMPNNGLSDVLEVGASARCKVLKLLKDLQSC